MKTSYTSITQLNRLGTVQLFGGENSLPYVQADGQYYYYGFNEAEKVYELKMTSLKDLQEQEQ